MPWIILTEADVQTKLSNPELQALKTAVLADGQANPLPEIISVVVQEVRGYVAVKHHLGAGETIPNKLESAALAIIRYRLATRLPVKSLLNDYRVKENDQAIDLLKLVARGDFAVEEPEDVDETETIAAPTPSFTPRKSKYTRCDQDGI